MATKKTIKSVPAVVKATPETQEARTDGEYNKYPVYHGCIRFDDDNIYEIEQNASGIRILFNNEVIYPAKPVSPSYDFSGLLKKTIPSTVTPDDLSLRGKAVYFNADTPIMQRGAGLVSATNSTFGKKAYAFYKQLQRGNVKVSPNCDCDIYLNVEPAEYAFYTYPDVATPNVHVYCAFGPVDDATISSWGLKGATMHFNVPFPPESEFLERYKDL